MPATSQRSGAAQRRRRATYALSAAVALLATLLVACEPGPFPPGFAPRDLSRGTAVAHALVDRPVTERGPRDPTALDELRDEYQFDALTNRALPIARALTSRRALGEIGRAAGIDPGEIAVSMQNTASVPRTLVEPDSELRSSQLATADRPYRLELQTRPGETVIDIYAVAPTAEDAGRLAAATVAGGNAFLAGLAADGGTTAEHQITLTGLGPPLEGGDGARSGLLIALLTFALAFAIAFAALSAGARWRLRSTGLAEPARDGQEEQDEEPGGGNWPHTSRPLPWAIAAFLALLWLVPFNAITLNVSTPIDLTLDRLLLPALIAVWIAALVRGGPGAPRLRLTRVHAAVGGFAAVAALSVIVNAGELAHGLVLELPIKKLGLLATYAALCVIVASSIRPREVRPMLTYVLVLGCVCAAGMLYEYRSGVNLFYDLAGLLPGAFTVAPPPTGFDELGRGSVSGPTDHGLEATAVLAMTLPIALVGLIERHGLWPRLAHGLAACLIAAGAVATFRKSGLLAPLAAVATLVWLARRDALRLAPLGIAVALVLPFASFQALSSVTGQLDTNRLDVPTVGDRVSDYNAVRPDFLSHPLFGAGFGSYEHASNPGENRILDSDLLMRLVEMGTVGLAAFLAMIGIVAVTAGRVARTRDPARAGPAMAIAAAAVAFGVLSAFFDEWSFPHAPYVFLTLAGLLAAMTRSEERTAPASAARARATGRTRATPAPRSRATAGKPARSTAR